MTILIPFEKSQVDAIYIDFKKSLTVNHLILLILLKKLFLTHWRSTLKMIIKIYY